MLKLWVWKNSVRLLESNSQTFSNKIKGVNLKAILIIEYGIRCLHGVTAPPAFVRNKKKLDDAIYGDTTDTLLMKFKRDGERDIEKISFAVEDSRSRQIAEGVFSLDGFTEEGSDTQSNLSIQFGDDTHDCSIWSVNHYLGLNWRPYVIEKPVEALREFGTGSGTSAISGGMNSLHKKIDQTTALLGHLAQKYDLLQDQLALSDCQSLAA